MSMTMETARPRPLTARQTEVLRLIAGPLRAGEAAPTMRALAETLGTSHVNVYEHIGALIRKGWLYRHRPGVVGLGIPEGVRLPWEGGRDEAAARLLAAAEALVSGGRRGEWGAADVLMDAIDAARAAGIGGQR